eukprot:3430003-Amphidinium_carterae.1
MSKFNSCQDPPLAILWCILSSSVDFFIHICWCGSSASLWNAESGSRKVVVTRDVEAGELLFVQQAVLKYRVAHVGAFQLVDFSHICLCVLLLVFVNPLIRILLNGFLPNKTTLKRRHTGISNKT